MKNTQIIKKNHEFQRIYRKGKFSAGKWLTIYCFGNNRQYKRIGITVSKKIGKSVKRNRLKRLIRENYRIIEPFISDGYDLLFVVRMNEEMPDFYMIKKEMRYLFKKLNILKKEANEH